MDPNELIDPVQFFTRKEDQVQEEPVKKKPKNKSYVDKLVDIVSFEEKEKSNEEKTYILLYTIEDEISTEIYNCYKTFIGRSNIYAFIRSALLEKDMHIDVHNDKVLTETYQTETKTQLQKYFLLSLDKALSVYEFMKYSEKFFPAEVGDEAFDIEDYNYSVSDIPLNPVNTNSEAYNLWASVMKEKQE